MQVGRAVSLVLGFALLATPSLAAGIFDFDDVVEQHLSGLGVDIEDVDELQMEIIRNEIRGKRRDVGVNAWVRLNSCESGRLVIEMNMNGDIVQVFTRGGCELPDIKSFR